MASTTRPAEGEAVAGDGGDGAAAQARPTRQSKAASYRARASADATVRAYASDMAAYGRWCSANGLAPLPATPQAVGDYLAACGEGYAMPTLRRRVAAIAKASASAGHPLDTRHPSIAETLAGIARTHGTAGKKAAAITVEDVRRLCAACGDGLRGRRDRALVLVGFAGALRRSELVALDVAHLAWSESRVAMTIGRSKTDQEGKGATVEVSAGKSPETCPVAALRAWLEEAEISEGPVFRAVTRTGKARASRLSADGVRHVLQACARAAGIEGTLMEPISPHGLRAGFITSAFAAGLRDEEIMGHTRHGDLETMRGYVRRSRLPRRPASGKVGL